MLITVIILDKKINKNMGFSQHLARFLCLSKTEIKVSKVRCLSCRKDYPFYYDCYCYCCCYDDDDDGGDNDDYNSNSNNNYYYYYKPQEAYSRGSKKLRGNLKSGVVG